MSGKRRETAGGAFLARGGEAVRSLSSRWRTVLLAVCAALVLAGGSVAAIAQRDDGAQPTAATPSASDTSPGKSTGKATGKPTGKATGKPTGTTTKQPQNSTGPGGKKNGTKPPKVTPSVNKNQLEPEVLDLRGRTRLELAGQLQDEDSGVPAAVFRPATLNLLGDSHTRQGGNKSGYGSGAQRMGGAVSMLRSLNIDVVALQEFESVQKGAFNRITGGSWDVYTGSERGRDSVAWRTDTWEYLDGATRSMPYFRGNQIPMPYVMLRHRETGRVVYFISMHNPTSNARRGNNQHWRNVATSIQINLVKELSADGTPVVLMGDFNERQEAFCRVAGAGLVAANGGTGQPCRPPAQIGIDWIFATPSVSFSNYSRVDGPAMNRITDHPLIVATATYGLPYEVPPAPPQTYLGNS